MARPRCCRATLGSDPSGCKSAAATPSLQAGSPQGLAPLNTLRCGDPLSNSHLGTPQKLSIHDYFVIKNAKCMGVSQMMNGFPKREFMGQKLMTKNMTNNMSPLG